MTSALLVVLTLGVNLVLWTLVGLLRTAVERVQQRAEELVPARERAPTGAALEHAVRPGDVAAVVPARNEAKGIEGTLRSLSLLLPASHIHVVSDGSDDGTAGIAAAAGVRVLELGSPHGKAGALRKALDHFELTRTYKAVLIVDGDTQLDRMYLATALPSLSRPGCAAVAGYATTTWAPHAHRFREMVLIGHRERIYVLMQMLLKFGQTAPYANVTYIIPGFASLYRTDVLDEIDIDAPGLIIEDFNMTFEVHRKRLGRIAFSPHTVAYTQDPVGLRDYVRQVRRWSLGFWQTLRRHGFWPSMFSAALALFLLELLTSSVMFVLLPVALLLLAFSPLTGGALVDLGALAGVHGLVATHLSWGVIVVAIVVPDYLLTCGVAWYQRRPRFLVYGLGFLPLRVLDAAIALYTLPVAFRDRSTGVWVSPTRREPPPTTREPGPGG